MSVITGRSLVIIMSSFAVVVLSGASVYVVWQLTPALVHIIRGVISLFAWITSFALGSMVFWTLTNHLTTQKKS